ncbi:MAG TPA: ABC transporter permease [Terriglobales bacterium]|nr:ABC transporter permease [Terriglobales bacterium]
MSWVRRVITVTLEHLLADIRYAARGMQRSPGFFITAVLMLALGIGINTAIFSVFSQVLLAPLQFADPGSLYVVSSHAASLGDARRASSGPDFRNYRDQNTVFSGVAAVIGHFTLPWTGDGPPRIVNVTAPTLEFFTVMGIRPALGRLYTPEEYKSLQNQTMVISWKFWKEQLGGDPHVIGRVLHFEEAPSTIVGVLPPMNDLYSDTDIWAKLTTEPSWPYMNWRANKFLDVIGRLKSDADRAVAEQQLTSILRRGEGEPGDVQVQLTPLKEFIVGPVTRQLDIIMAAVAVVLLVTCLNTAALLLSRAVKRSPEMAVRLGLGASRGRIRQQLLVEGLVLSASGGALGVALASLLVGLVRQIPGLALPRLEELHLNFAALCLSIAVVVLTSIVFAILPASALSGLNISAGLHGGHTETGKAQRRPFSELIIAEVACAVLLTVCAGLLVRSFVRVQSVDLGFEPAKVLTAYLRTNYFGPEGYAFWHEVLNAASSVPGASAAAVSDCMPGARANAASLTFSDRANDPNHAPSSEACWISPDFFRTMGSSLLQGRFFSDRDNENSPPAIIINAEAARQFFPGVDPLGKQITVNYLALGSRNNRPPPPREIVGIVSNVRQRALDLPSEPAIYMPYTQDDTHHVLASMNLFVRSAGRNPGLLANSVRTKIQSMYPNQPVERVTVMRDVVSRSLARRKYSVGLMTAFAMLALLLCALGIYGVVSYVTLQRTREFGIRMALGASRQDVVCNVLHQGGSLILIGSIIGFTLALLAARGLSQLLFETNPFDPAIFVSAVLLLAFVGILACLVPGLRASQLDPRVALNTE